MNDRMKYKMIEESYYGIADQNDQKVIKSVRNGTYEPKETENTEKS